jgi:hypothetical protein
LDFRGSGSFLPALGWAARLTPGGLSARHVKAATAAAFSAGGDGVVNPHEAGVIAAGRRSHHASSSRRASRCAVAVDARLWHHEDRSPTHGYEPTREAAMAAFREELAAK